MERVREVVRPRCFLGEVSSVESRSRSFYFSTYFSIGFRLLIDVHPLGVILLKLKGRQETAMTAGSSLHSWDSGRKSIKKRVKLNEISTSSY